MVQILTLIPVLIVVIVALVHVTGREQAADKLGILVLPVIGVNLVALTFQTVAFEVWLATAAASVAAVGVASYIRGYEHGQFIVEHLLFHQEVLAASTEDDPVYDLLGDDHLEGVEMAVDDLRTLRWQGRRFLLVAGLLLLVLMSVAGYLDLDVIVMLLIPLALATIWWWGEGYGVSREVRAHVPDIATMALGAPLWGGPAPQVGVLPPEL